MVKAFSANDLGHIDLDDCNLQTINNPFTENM
jgi:hypothetical protein